MQSITLSIIITLQSITITFKIFKSIIITLPSITFLLDSIHLGV